MKCPGCDALLVTYELEGVEVDHCPSCGGTWLDSGELEFIVERAGACPGRLSEALERTGEGPRTQRRCPRCGRKMREVAVGECPSVELDRCPWGHGLWLDRGELRAVSEAFHDGEEGSVARFFTELYSSELKSEAEGG